MLRQAIIAAAATLLTLGAAGGARADASAKAANANSGWNTNFSDPQTLGSWGVQPDHKTLQFNDKGKWGLKLDMEKPIGRDMDWKDVRAGAYLHLTPNIRVGGTVGLGDKLAQPQKVTPQDTNPRVHLETAFKF